MGSLVTVRRQPAGTGKTVSASVRAARSFSSIMCWVPILVDLRRPERIHRRTVSGSRLALRAASGTVITVARYYNNSWVLVLGRRAKCSGSRCPKQLAEKRDVVQASLGSAPVPDAAGGEAHVHVCDAAALCSTPHNRASSHRARVACSKAHQVRRSARRASPTRQLANSN